MSAPVRWGLLGTGGICRAFAADLPLARDARLAAVASRDAERARAFAREHGAERWHEGYEALAADPGVDVVYIGTPHPCHQENALLCLRHGKHVLCEKPLALNLRQAEAMMAAAEAAGRFLMEALVTACFPAVDRLRTLVHDGTIGRLEGIEASYGLEVPYDPEHRMFAPALGGGALLDLGVYPLAMATLVVDGAPLHIESTVRRAPSGVDDHVSMLVHYADSVTAHLVCASRQELPRKAVFVGSRGRIVVPPPFSTPGQLEVWPAQGDAQTHVFETQGAGYALEADEVRDCLRAGRLESPRWPWSASRAVLSIADAVRNEHGLTYPAD